MLDRPDSQARSLAVSLADRRLHSKRRCCSRRGSGLAVAYERPSCCAWAATVGRRHLLHFDVHSNGDVEFVGTYVILLRQGSHARSRLARDAHKGGSASVSDEGEEGRGNLAVTFAPIPRNEFRVTENEFRVGLGVWLGRGAG